MTNNSTSRRNFALGAGLIGAAAGGSRLQAQSTPAPANPDISILNYALTLEHLEATFYTQSLQAFGARDFSSAVFASVLGSGTVNGVLTNLARIRDHEVAHVEALQTTIRSLGGTPVEACTYNFPYRTPDEFLQVAQVLEETGVQAYDGALAMLQSAALKAAGASIATVEARHAAYLNLVNSSIPFPKAFDEAKMMKDILAAAGAFIVSCPTSNGPAPTATMAVLLPKSLSTLSRNVDLDVSQSMSGTGQPLTYMVRSISGAASVLRANTDKPAVQLSGGYGDYIFELTVTDSNGMTATDRTTIRYVGN